MAKRVSPKPHAEYLRGYKPLEGRTWADMTDEERAHQMFLADLQREGETELPDPEDL